MDVVLVRTFVLLAIAIIVAIAARRLHMPYTVGLVLTGLFLSLIRVETGVVLTHDFIFDVILPPLLFEAALSIDWMQLKRESFPVLALSICGVIISAVTVTLGMTASLGWPFSSALIFGLLLAATDPVSVIALLKDAGLRGRLRLIIESESLFNDGVAAALFGFVLIWAQHQGEQIGGVSQVLQSLALNVGGGILAGLVVSSSAVLVAGRTSDHLVEATLTTIAAYGSFLVAERVGVSGVLATVTAGLLMGNSGVLSFYDLNPISERGREFVEAFWEFAAFIANSIVFLAIGITVAHIPFDRLQLGSLFIAILLVLIGRALSVYPLYGLLARSRWSITISEQHVLWWGGLRGALGLALALALPSNLLLRNEIVIVAFGVVTFSVLVQGLTIPRLLRRLGLISAQR